MNKIKNVMKLKEIRKDLPNLQPNRIKKGMKIKFIATRRAKKGEIFTGTVTQSQNSNGIVIAEIERFRGKFVKKTPITIDHTYVLEVI